METVKPVSIFYGYKHAPKALLMYVVLALKKLVEDFGIGFIEGMYNKYDKIMPFY